MRHSYDDVDFSQRTAVPPDDDDAEHIARALQRDNPYWHLWHDPEERAQFVEGLRDALNGAGKREKQESAKPPEERMDYNKFFSDIEEMRKQIPKKL